MFRQPRPIALCTSAAATVESTPPLNPQMPTYFHFSRITAVVSSMRTLRRSTSVRLRTREIRNFLMQFRPGSVWFTSGWNSIGVNLLLRIPRAMAFSVLPMSENPLEGSHVIAVAVPNPQGRGNPREEL